MGFDKQSEIRHPLARSEQLVIQNVGDEIVAYDEETKTAHALKPVAAAVFMYADGKNTPAEIAELASYRLDQAISVADVNGAVAELDSCGLLEGPQGPLRRGISRRDALKTFAAAGAGTMLISSVAAPFAMAGNASDGASFVCGTNDSNLTGTYNGSSVSWPQPWTSSGLATPNTPGGPTSTGAGAYELGAGCVVNNQICTYTSTDGSETLTGPCSVFQCGSGVTDVCLLGINSQVDGTKVGTAGGYVENVSAADCGTGKKVCAKPLGGGNYEAQPGVAAAGGNLTCPYDYPTLITLNSTDAVLVNGKPQTGTYACVPCDGNIGGSHYQCCEVACVPAGIGMPAGAVTTGEAITSSGGYPPYTQSTTSIWPWLTDYPNKWCTDNPCNKSGTCS